ncbi:hypothetical protein AAFC00_002005 [Neodothiora populina]
MEVPFTRVYESIYCYKYWEVHDSSKLLQGRDVVGPGAIGGVSEALCKIPEVQADVAALMGNLAFFNGIPSLLLAIPFGILADSWGRKPVILLGLSSFPLCAAWIMFVCWFWQFFDIRLIWLSSLHGIMGGSSTVVTALFLTLLSDLVPEESRATVFLQTHAATLAMSFVIPPLAASLMVIDPWIPLFSGLAALTFSIFLMYFIPETIHHHHASVSGTQQREPPEAESTRSTWIAPLKAMGRLLLSDWRVSGLIATFTFQSYSTSWTTVLLLQYASTRYRMSLTRATFYVSLRAGFTVPICLALTPIVAKLLLSKFGYNAKQRDLVLAQALTVLTCFGWLLVALAPTIAMFVGSLLVLTLGCGYATFLRTVMTSLVAPSDVAKLYTVISVVDTVGMMGGSPLFAWLFKVGLNIGDGGAGLPFCCLGIFYAACAGLAFCVRIRKTDRGEQIDEEFTEP